MNKQKLITILIIILFFVDLYVMIFWSGSEYVDLSKNVLLSVGQVIAIAGGIYAVKKFGRNNKTGKTVSIFTLGLFFWMLGNIIFATTDFLHGQAEFPSMADVSIFIGYALLLASLLHETRSRNVSLTRIQKLLLAIVALLTSFLVLYFNVFLVFDPATPILVTVATIIYSLADILLATTLILVLILASTYSGGKLFYPWFYLFIAVTCMLIGDALFSIWLDSYLNKEGYYLLIDAVWRLGYVFFAIGLFNLGFIIENIQKKITIDTLALKNKN